MSTPLKTEVSALILDLDKTVADPRTMGEGFVEPILALARLAAEDGSIDPATVAAIARDIWFLSFADLGRKHALPSALADQMAEVYRNLEASPSLKSYGDEDIIFELSVPKKFLVTSGYQKLQRSKIAILGLWPRFDGIIIDDIDAVPRRGKQAAFQGLLTVHGLDPAAVVVIGDGLSEIEAGNSLGIPTVQVLREGVARVDDADYHVASFSELPALPLFHA